MYSIKIYKLNLYNNIPRKLLRNKYIEPIVNRNNSLQINMK